MREIGAGVRGRAAALVTALLLVAGAILPAAPSYAEEYTGGDGWRVEFNSDRKMVSTFRSKDIADTIAAIQPGDRVTIGLTLTNTSELTTDWYMTNEVLSSLEDSRKAAGGGAYTYILTYEDHEGKETTLYSSESVGGEKESTAGEGLNEATDNLDEFFYLDRLATGQSGHVTLVVALDGETQGNAYQDTLADLQMNFAVEEVSTTPGDDKPGKTHSLNTGDESNALGWSAAALGSGAVLLLLAFLNHKRREKEAEGGAQA